MGADRDVVSRTTPAAPASSNSTGTAASTNGKSRKSKGGGGGTGLNDLFIIIFGVAFLLSLSLNMLHSTGSIPHEHNTAIHQAMDDFKKNNNPSKSKVVQQLQVGLVDVEPELEADELNLHQQHPPVEESHQEQPVLSKLNCDAFGGPPMESAQEMVWWADIPSDANYISPFYDAGVKRYMTFEPDGGGKTEIEQYNINHHRQWQNSHSRSNLYVNIRLEQHSHGHGKCDWIGCEYGTNARHATPKENVFARERRWETTEAF
jgi:hypothetical protein